MLKKKESIEGLVNRGVETKLASALKTQVTLENKNISAEEFNKMLALYFGGKPLVYIKKLRV